MPNLTPAEIADAIAEILESAEGYGIVLTEKKFAESNAQLSRLLKGQADTDYWRGWLVSWVSIQSQESGEGDSYCEVVTTYLFGLKFFHFYQDDFTSTTSTEMSFKAALFAANEALNASRDLGFAAEHTIKHNFLQSVDDFTVESIGGGSADLLCHTAIFILEVEVINRYED